MAQRRFLIITTEQTPVSECAYLVVPGLVLVVDDRGSQAPGRVDAGAGDGDGGQVHHEHGEPNGEGSQHLHRLKGKTTVKF